MGLDRSVVLIRITGAYGLLTRMERNVRQRELVVVCRCGFKAAVDTGPNDGSLIRG
jgi:hypothetical protein